jgi:hypothetical protein
MHGQNALEVCGVICRGVGSLCDDVADEIVGHRSARHPQGVHGALTKLHAHVDLLPPISHLDEVKGLLLVKRVVDLVVPSLRSGYDSRGRPEGWLC